MGELIPAGRCCPSPHASGWSGQQWRRCWGPGQLRRARRARATAAAAGRAWRTHVLGVVPEALAADHDAVLADDGVLVRAHAAAGGREASGQESAWARREDERRPRGRFTDNMTWARREAAPASASRTGHGSRRPEPPRSAVLPPLTTSAPPARPS